jgi:hypothetical protein
MSDKQHGDWRDDHARRSAEKQQTAALGLSDPLGPQETFEDYQVRQLRAQSVAAESTAQSVETIKNILVVWAIVTVVGLIVLLAGGLR